MLIPSSASDSAIGTSEIETPVVLMFFTIALAKQLLFATSMLARLFATNAVERKTLLSLDYRPPSTSTPKVKPLSPLAAIGREISIYRWSRRGVSNIPLNMSVSPGSRLVCGTTVLRAPWSESSPGRGRKSNRRLSFDNSIWRGIVCAPVQLDLAQRV